MKAPPTSQTMVLANPDSAQLTLWVTTLKPGFARSAGLNRTQRDSTAPSVSPTSPTAVLGIGSVTNAATTPLNNAK
jgi:hypothetical protein